MKIFQFVAFLLMVTSSVILSGQCSTWVGIKAQSDAENAHTIYRQALKSKDYPIAFENWSKAYSLAPAADGKRDYHYMDGIDLYKIKLETETDEAKKAEYKKRIIELYDEAIACYTAGIITLKNPSPEALSAKLGYLYGRKAYDQFYLINAPYAETKASLDKSIQLAGNNTEYIVFDPYGYILVYDFQNGAMKKEDVLSVYKQLNGIAEYNIANNEAYSEGYQQAWAAMDGTISKIEKDIFDCQYFKDKLLPEYAESNNDPQILQRVIATLKTQGCPDSDPDIMKLDAAWKTYATTENARLLAEYEANNPAAAAKAAYDSGKYSEAIEKYRTAIAEETDPAKKASYLFSVASIEFRKLNQYSKARSTAYEAAKLNPNWGRPYMLIGDMYGKTARSCGDAWTQRLAILAAIDKYAYAKSIDGEVAGEAQERISAYYGSLPDKQEGFMRGVSEGQTASVGCWIGESVKVRFK